MNIELLTNKDNNIACKEMFEIQKESILNNSAYQFLDAFIEMISNTNSYIRTRGLVLIAENARWDTDCKIDEIIDEYLKHITDDKPITARQCIKMLPVIAKYKPDLSDDIAKALRNANVSFYKDSMRPLVEKDIKEALKQIGRD